MARHTYTYFDGDTFEREGYKFTVTHPFDDTGDAPWERCDGHGPVSKWERRSKRAGEHILCSDHGSHRFYAWQEAIELAKRDGWGLSDSAKADLCRRLGREPTKGEIREEAVKRDFEYLRGWCNDKWHYCGVVVTLLDSKGEETDESESLWGIEDNAYDYLRDTAHDLADEIISRLRDRENVERSARLFEACA